MVEVRPQSTVFGVVSTGSYTHKPSRLARHSLAIGIAGNYSEFSIGLSVTIPVSEHRLAGSPLRKVPTSHQPEVPTGIRLCL